MSIQNIFTKKIVLAISSVYVVSLALYFIYQGGCYASDFCGHQMVGNIQMFLFVGSPFTVVFLTSLLTYTMDDRIFSTWGKFAGIIAPINMAFFYWLIQQRVNALGAGMVFALVISFGIILWKTWSIRKRPFVKMKG